MKDSKFVTPTLLFLMIILLLISVYHNFLYKPLESKIQSITMENEYLKNQRLEIELAMVNTDTIKENIENMKKILENDQDMSSIDGKMLTDDINSNAKISNINLNNISIGEPLIGEGQAGGQKVLIFIPANLSFTATYQSGANFIGSFENSKIGAYKLNNIDVQESDGDQLNWNVTLILYYYGDPKTANKPEQENSEADDGEAKEWTQ